MWVSCVLLVLVIFNKVNAMLHTNEDSAYSIDSNLHEALLDPDLCQRQLQYLRQDNLLLLARFVDAGLRIPKGILLGNLQDYGLYPQCLGIKEVFEEMTIQGKYCKIRVPLNQYFPAKQLSDVNYDFNPQKMQLDNETITKINNYKNVMMRNMRSVFTNAVVDTRFRQESPLSQLAFQLAVCVPSVCTTQDALSALMFNVTALGLNYEDVGCRLPNDRPWVTADYIAIIVFSILGIITLTSTAYDVHHSVIKKKDPKQARALFTSFSAYTNCRRILTIEYNPNAIQCLDGIRALAIYWVVVGHVFVVISVYILNTLDVAEWIRSANSRWILAAPFTVDSFFLMSGLLLIYTTAGKLTANQLIRNLPIFYLNRLLRLFPVLAALILFEASFLNRLGDGPNWDFISSSVQNCRKYWWSTLLHLQNYINPRHVCLGVSWYLAIDVNLHILSPLILFWVLGRRKRLALSALAIALIISLTIATAYIFTTEFSELTYFTHYYVSILARSPPFFIGMVYGYLLHLSRGKERRMPFGIGILLTTFSILLIGGVIYCSYLGDQPNLVNNQIVQNTFDTFLRPMWACALGWIIFACHNGYAGPINWFLSLNIWKIPARISYAIYLFHMSFIMAVYSNSLQQKYFSVSSIMFNFMAFLAIAHVVSFFITALIDSPFANIVKILLQKGSKVQTQKRKSISEDRTINNGSLPRNK